MMHVKHTCDWRGCDREIESSRDIRVVIPSPEDSQGHYSLEFCIEHEVVLAELCRKVELPPIKKVHR